MIILETLSNTDGMASDSEVEVSSDPSHRPSGNSATQRGQLEVISCAPNDTRA